MSAIETYYKMFKFLYEKRGYNIPIAINILFKEEITKEDVIDYIDEFEVKDANDGEPLFGLHPFFSHLYNINNTKFIKFYEYSSNEVNNEKNVSSRRFQLINAIINTMIKIVIDKRDVAMIKQVSYDWPKALKNNIRLYYDYKKGSLNNTDGIIFFKTIYPFLQNGKEYILSSLIYEVQNSTTFTNLGLDYFISLANQGIDAELFYENLVRLAQTDKSELLYYILGQLNKVVDNQNSNKFPEYFHTIFKNDDFDFFKKLLFEDKFSIRSLNMILKEIKEFKMDNHFSKYINLIESYLK